MCAVTPVSCVPWGGGESSDLHAVCTLHSTDYWCGVCGEEGELTTTAMLDPPPPTSHPAGASHISESAAPRFFAIKTLVT